MIMPSPPGYSVADGRYGQESFHVTEGNEG